MANTVVTCITRAYVPTTRFVSSRSSLDLRPANDVQ
jgi:hypothetical protein